MLITLDNNFFITMGGLEENLEAFDPFRWAEAITWSILKRNHPDAKFDDWVIGHEEILRYEEKFIQTNWRLLTSKGFYEYAMNQWKKWIRYEEKWRKNNKKIKKQYEEHKRRYEEYMKNTKNT